MSKSKIDLKVVAPINPLYGKTLNVIGDSITWALYLHEGSTVRGFAKILEDIGMTVRNYGISGTTIAARDGYTNSFTERYSGMNDSTDYILVFGGTNDFANALTIGTMADRVNTTFYGACHVLFAGLISKYPSKIIGIITPIVRSNMDGATKLEPYASAVKEVAHYYSLPVLDLFNEGNMTLRANGQTYLFDGTHPENEGHKLLARKIEAFLKVL